VCDGDTDTAASAASPAAPAATQAKAHAPEPAADRRGASPAAPRATVGSPIQQPPKAHAPERGPAASDAAPAALLNRAARRRWKSLQRHLHRAPARAPSDDMRLICGAAVSSVFTLFSRLPCAALPRTHSPQYIQCCISTGTSA
jgi:hypothetical protein